MVWNIPIPVSYQLRNKLKKRFLMCWMKQKMSNNSSSQDIIMILDESGSMHTMGVEPIQAVNAFITEQQRIPEKVGCTFSLWKFNTNVNQVIDDQPLKDVTEFKDYRVG